MAPALVEGVSAPPSVHPCLSAKRRRSAGVSPVFFVDGVEIGLEGHGSWFLKSGVALSRLHGSQKANDKQQSIGQPHPQASTVHRPT